MRAECQEAETVVSYLRRMVQGRLDLVHSFIDHHNTARASATSMPWWSDLPSIIGSGPARPQGYGRLPSQMSPDLEKADLTRGDRRGPRCRRHRQAHHHERSRAAAPGRTAHRHRAAHLRPAPGPARAHRPAAGGDRQSVQDGRGVSRRPVGLTSIAPAPERRCPSNCPTGGVTSVPSSANNAVHGPPVAAPAVGAGRDLEPLPEPDRTGPAPALGGDPPADRQGVAHLGRDALRPGRHPRAGNRAKPTWRARSWPTRI